MARSASVACAPLALLGARFFMWHAFAPVRVKSRYAIAISIDGRRRPVDFGRSFVDDGCRIGPYGGRSVGLRFSRRIRFVHDQGRHGYRVRAGNAQEATRVRMRHCDRARAYCCDFH